MTSIDPEESEKPVPTQVQREPWEVLPRLASLGLNLDALLRVVTVARTEGLNATPFHCANASGTFSYQHGTFALRNEFVGKGWRVERPEGVEAIRNDALNIRVVFSNVDVSCNDNHLPKPRSTKGSGAERVCIGNMFGDLPHYARKPRSDDATYYLMMDESGAAELSRPVVSNNTFTACIERIYLTKGGDGLDPFKTLDDDDAADDFDPQVARK